MRWLWISSCGRPYPAPGLPGREDRPGQFFGGRPVLSLRGYYGPTIGIPNEPPEPPPGHLTPPNPGRAEASPTRVDPCTLKPSGPGGATVPQRCRRIWCCGRVSCSPPG